MRRLCLGKIDVTTSLDSILNNEGEGIVLRQRDSKYYPGRSERLLKLKVQDWELMAINFI